MTIKEVEGRTGLPRASVRFYEKECLLIPDRNEESNYRKYTEKDIAELERIKLLRCIGLSVAEIRDIKDNHYHITAFVSARKEKIKLEMEELERTLKICDMLENQQISVEELDVGLLELKKQLWKKEYRNIIESDRENNKEQVETVLRHSIYMLMMVLVGMGTILERIIAIPQFIFVGLLGLLVILLILFGIVRNS